MVRHDGVDDIISPALRHVATNAVTGRKVGRRVAIAADAVVIRSRRSMRIVARGASQLAGTLQKALRLAHPVRRVRDLESVTLAARAIERQAEARHRLSRYVRERAAIQPLDGVGQ